MKKTLKEDSGALAETSVVYSDKRDLSSYTKEELVSEVEKYRNLWSWIPDSIKYLLSNMGREVVIIDRNNKTRFGYFHGFECELTQYKVFSAAVRYDEVNHKPHIETGIDTLFSSNVTSFKFIETREEQETQT